MAHITKLGALTDELVILLTSASPKNSPARFNAYRESALRSLRYNNYARTNQFEVQNGLRGLEEKFRVYNEDDLADALRDRLEELSKESSKWTPEILHLLLELSDKPAVKTKLEFLEFLQPPEVNAEPTWKWEDWVSEDADLRDKNVWRNIDYDADSSDDDGASIDSNGFSGAADTTQSSVGETDPEPPEALIVNPDLSHLQNVLKGQFWKSQAQDMTDKLEAIAKPITEQQAIREVLFMLQGLPTSLFRAFSANNNAIGPTPGFTLPDVSEHVFYGFLREFASQGNALMTLRLWTGSEKPVPLVQSLHRQIEIRLQNFDSQLSDLQREFLDPRKDAIVSLVELQNNLYLPVHFLDTISEVVTRLIEEPYAHEFRFLELLFDQTCTSQNVGNDPLYQFMGNLFFDCFQTYLRPLKVWMEDGELLRDDNAFFVFESKEVIDIGLLWQDRYKLRKTKDGVVHAPRFLHTALSKIFTTGKSVVLLKQLGAYAISKFSHHELEPRLDFQTVCNPAAVSLAPFPELLAVAFDQWVQSKHHAVSSTLRNCLFEDQGLKSSLDALEAIYFMSNGSAANVFTNAVFEKLDAGNPNWNDRFTMTELMQSSIGEVEPVVSEAIKVSFPLNRREDPKQSRKSVKSLASIQVSYRLPWPVQIIVTPDTIARYQRIFTFLIQIRRASQVMESIRILRDKSNMSKSADALGLFYSLRSRLLWFTSTLYSYLTDVIIRVFAAKMREELKQAEDVDQMIQIHQGYIKRIANCALLGSKLDLIHESVVKVLDLSIQLSDARIKHIAAQDLPNSTTHGKTHQPKETREKRFKESDMGDDSDGDLAASSAEVPELGHVDELKALKSEFDHLCRFAATGLRGVARAGGEPTWDVLAERLEFGIGPM